MLDAPAEWEFSIPVSISDGPDTYDAIITNLYDDEGFETWRPERAVVAVGLYLTGRRAGQWLVLDDIESLELTQYVQ